jgi:hypothetical protein
MFPHQTPPVMRPTFFQTVFRIVEVPSLGDPTRFNEFRQAIDGADPDPNDPPGFMYPVSCEQECSILSGFSLARCLLTCR